MKKFIIFALLFFSLITYRLYSDEGLSKIFFVNFFSESVDVRLGEEGEDVFQMIGLEPNLTTYLLNTDSFGSYTLYVKLNSSEEWNPFVDNNGKIISCNVEPGKTHCIIIGSDGAIRYFTIKEDAGSGAKISFLNGNNTDVSRMEVSNDWGDNVVGYTENLIGLGLTDFVTFESGNYSLFWQFPDQQSRENYYYYADMEGNRNVITFEDGNYYLFICYKMDDLDYANVFIITPQ